LLGIAIASAILPNQIGFQDLGALIARQPAVSDHWRAYVFGSTPGTVRAARLNLPRPLGTAIPNPPLYALASVNPNAITGALGREILGDARGPLQFPSVNRAHKGDALVMRQRDPMPPRAPALDELVPTVETELPFTDVPAIEREMSGMPDTADEAALFFDSNPLDAPRERIAHWPSGEAPQIVGDPDIKLAALLPPEKNPAAAMPGETVAGKGEVTGIGKRPMSPAERLRLSATARAKAEKCLANAVYFEARDEPVRAQIGVAQVVLNRVFSPFYPKNVCDVVYQNSNRHLACQFTFACDGKRDAVTEPDAWARAKRIAADMLDGKLWMPEVAKSTHYHDDWAHPNWVHEMKRLDKQGGLIFYRPRNWGDGSEEPKWGDPKTTAKIAAKL
jgi:spore germination cell wall hydrolase CwlJ-like protein